MNQLQRGLVWLSRIHRCRGFGIQSPTDYAFVRYVVNEHWSYYAYDLLPNDAWLTRKLGKLYFRLANWRQPVTMLTDCYQAYWQSGCRKTRFAEKIQHVELARIDVDDRDGYESLLAQCDERSVVVVEGIWRNWNRWHEMERDVRNGTTFDLYYCGIIFYDIKRFKHNYQINF
ncbi:MAG: hypothetical protein K6E67_03535 [Prevotella sp.]|nr:hypothetical protein [Prevotella sp.]